jgi:catechol 2,3-dioxygenase-like lactoylglutathione lyase family enzyme
VLTGARMNGFVPTKDAEEARSFYEGLLGFALVSDNQYVATLRSGEMTIMLQKIDDAVPEHRTILGWEVTNIRDAVSSLSKRGATFERYGWMEQDDLGIWNSPDGKVAWFKDPDGNVISLSEH